MPFHVDNFWASAASGAYFLNIKVGYPAYVLEFVYQKYLNGCRIVTERGTYMKPNRVMLWVVAAYLKQYPKVGCFDLLAPKHRPMCDRSVRRLVRVGMTYLNGAMREISELHFTHPNNHVPHFPADVVGGVDTFPIFCLRKKHRNQPKYKHAVVKFQSYVSHLGMHGYLSGPHPGAASDTTTARRYHPVGNYTFLADLAYISVPHCLPPFGEDMCQASQLFAEFTRVHQWYRARTEHAFGRLNKFAIVANIYRGYDMTWLGMCVRVLCSLESILHAFRVPYPPYDAC